MPAAGDSLSWSRLTRSLRSCVAGRLPVWLTAAGTGLAITLGQVLLVCALSGASHPAEAYQRLWEWDSTWYTWIAEHGYPDTLPQNREEMQHVGFFPGYPLVTRGVAEVTGLPIRTALLVTAQLFSVGVWTYVLLFLRRWKTPTLLSVLTVTALLVQPCAFYLVVGYSESMFLFGVLGFLFWSSRGNWVLAAVHGVLMTATRIVGLPLVICPLVGALVLWWWGQPGEGDAKARWRNVVAAGLLAAVASLGGLLFFAYCQVTYGRWDAYFYAQKMYWGVTPDYLALFRPHVYFLAPPDYVDGVINPNYVSRISVPVTGIAVLAIVLLELRSGKGDLERLWLTRLPLYLASGLMFAIAVAGLANMKLISMSRYVLCVHVVLALAAAHLLNRCPALVGWRRILTLGGFALAALAALSCQIAFIQMFTRWVWVT